jgi:hypothetical protein
MMRERVQNVVKMRTRTAIVRMATMKMQMRLDGVSVI